MNDWVFVLMDGVNKGFLMENLLFVWFFKIEYDLGFKWIKFFLVMVLENVKWK